MSSEEKNFKLINGDAAVELKKMQTNSIDHVITSPPYNMNLRIRNGKYCSRQIVKEFSTKYEGFDDNLSIDEYYNFHKNIINELLRVTKGYIFYVVQPVTGNKPALYKLLGEFSNNIKEVIIWNKMNGQPAMANGVMNSVFEYVIVFSKNETEAMSRQFKNALFDRGTLDNVWNIKRKRSISSTHAATFPEELIEKIIQNFTHDGEIILDPFSGTSTTGVVCLKNNRQFVGIELIKEYFDLSFNRLHEVNSKKIAD